MIKIKTITCDKCYRNISLSNFKRHYNHCNGTIKKHLHIEECWKQNNGLYQCPYCKKEYTKNGISSHIIYKHIKISGFKIYSNKIKKGETKHWAKGLTKETSEIIKNISETKIKKYESGKLIPTFKGKKHTDISKLKIKNSVLNSIKNSNCSSWKSRKIKSYPEQYFQQILDNKNITYESEYHVNDGIRNYFLDFYFIDKQIDLEIDGSQHKNRVESDKRRDKYLNSLGIKVFRIDWKNPKTIIGKKYIENKLLELINLIK